ncbi:hypothetical protein ABK040_001019 [Willaertia magna]
MNESKSTNNNNNNQTIQQTSTTTTTVIQTENNDQQEQLNHLNNNNYNQFFDRGLLSSENYRNFEISNILNIQLLDLILKYKGNRDLKGYYHGFEEEEEVLTNNDELNNSDINGNYSSDINGNYSDNSDINGNYKERNYYFSYSGKFLNGYMNDENGHLKFYNSSSFLSNNNLNNNLNNLPIIEYIGKNNNLNKYTIIKWQDGSKYKGEIKDGLRHGFGKFTCCSINGKNNKSKYIGQWFEGKRHGKGILFYSINSNNNNTNTSITINSKNNHSINNNNSINGNIERYEGEFKNNKRDGYGIMYYKSGSYYEGNWSKNLREGKGKMYWTNDPMEIYDGDWHNDLPNGKGKHFYFQHFINNNTSNNTSINGMNHFNNNLNNNKCNYYEGEYKNGMREGFGTFYYADGSFYSGNWSFNRKNGHGYFYNVNGTSEYGIWKNDKLIILEHHHSINGNSINSNLNNNLNSNYSLLMKITIYINDLLLRIDGNLEDLNKIDSLILRNIRRFKSIFMHYSKYGIEVQSVKKFNNSTTNLGNSFLNQTILNSSDKNKENNEEEENNNLQMSMDDFTIFNNLEEIKLLVSKDNKMSMIQFWKFAHDFNLINDKLSFAQIDRIYIYVCNYSNATINTLQNNTLQNTLQNNTLQNNNLQNNNLQNNNLQNNNLQNNKSQLLDNQPIEALVNYKHNHNTSNYSNNFNNGVMRFREFIEAIVRISVEIYKSTSVHDRFKKLLEEKINGRITDLPEPDNKLFLNDNLNNTLNGNNINGSTINLNGSNSKIVIVTENNCVKNCDNLTTADMNLNKEISKIENFKILLLNFLIKNENQLKQFYNYFITIESGFIIKEEITKTMTIKQFLRMLNELLILNRKNFTIEIVIEFIFTILKNNELLMNNRLLLSINGMNRSSSNLSNYSDVNNITNNGNNITNNVNNNATATTATAMATTAVVNDKDENNSPTAIVTNNNNNASLLLNGSNNNNLNNITTTTTTIANDSINNSVNNNTDNNKNVVDINDNRMDDKREKLEREMSFDEFKELLLKCLLKRIEIFKNLKILFLLDYQQQQLNDNLQINKILDENIIIEELQQLVNQMMKQFEKLP